MEAVCVAVRKQLTLLLLHNNGRVLLGMKKRGFGIGKVRGAGTYCTGRYFASCILRSYLEADYDSRAYTTIQDVQ